MFGVKIYQETDDDRIHDTDSYYFNTEAEAKAFEEAMNKKGKELLDKGVYVEFDVWSYKIEPQTLSDALADANEWYNAVLNSGNEEEEVNNE